MVGERGVTLSGGQRQRLALARAILTDPRILVLDDATSAVDSATEEAIHDTLRELMADRTTILIAHRRSTLRLASRIVVLDAGRVVAEGTHEELLESSPVYRDLFAGPDDIDLTAGDDDLDGEGLGEVRRAGARRRRDHRVGVAGPGRRRRAGGRRPRSTRAPASAHRAAAEAAVAARWAWPSPPRRR